MHSKQTDGRLTWQWVVTAAYLQWLSMSDILWQGAYETNLKVTWLLLQSFLLFKSCFTAYITRTAICKSISVIYVHHYPKYFDGQKIIQRFRSICDLPRSIFHDPATCISTSNSIMLDPLRFDWVIFYPGSLETLQSLEVAFGSLEEASVQCQRLLLLCFEL